MKKTQKKKDQIFKESGSRGGNTTLEKYGKNHFSRIAKLRHRRAKQKRKAAAANSGT